MSEHSSFLPAYRPTVGDQCPASYAQRDSGNHPKSVDWHNTSANESFCGGTRATIPGINNELCKIGLCAQSTTIGDDFLPERRSFAEHQPAPPRPSPIAFLGRSFEVHELAGVRTVLRKGRQRYCWHPVGAALAALILAGIDTQAIRS